MATPDRWNYWKRINFYDPAKILRDLRRLEEDIAGIEDPMVRRLRTPALKKYREWRDGALFTYGMGVAQGKEMLYATEESSDYDFVVAWAGESEHLFCPVQLKELVPADLNPRATLEGLLNGLPIYSAGSDTVLAVKLNRRGKMDRTKIRLPPIPFKQLWFFWCASQDGTRWGIFGDALKQPGQAVFAYPA
jgi:hypothetical protein